MIRETILQLAYLAASFAFIFSLRALTRPETARQGYRLAIVGMAIAVVATLFHARIITYEWIVVGLAVGAVAGYPLGMFVPMTAMPERIAFSHAFGALAATLVGVGEFLHDLHGGVLAPFRMGALGFEVLFGALTVTGSLMAFGKLATLLPGRPLTYPLQNISNITLLAAGFGCMVYLVLASAGYVTMRPEVFFAMVAIGTLVGILMVIPIGGADMPVVISLLNSYAGLAACATGFAIDNTILIVAGALDGASGFILSIAMSKAMNRSFANVVFGAFGAVDQTGGGGGGAISGDMHPISAEDAAIRLAYAERVIFVPGYGLAVSQAQHQVRELADVIEKRGGNVTFAIHPVAGRMPGHMNVLLAEAGVPYDKLLDMEEINHKFADTDVVVVVGANDVVNPAAKTNKASPIYGMPILAVNEARSVIVLKRGQGAGFSGIENELFFDPKTSMLYGDAKKSLTTLVSEVKAA